MVHEHFAELKEWSERKHELVIGYLKGFVKILGGATKDKVFYVDGFAGLGIYDDGAKGSPVRAAEYALSVSEKYYQLHCINVESNKEHFNRLTESSLMCQDFVTNYCGNFGDHIDSIIIQIDDFPTIFFLDPFGVKGIEWQYIYPILKREPVTEILMRINPKDISRLAGFSDSDSPGAAKKRQLLTELYGFANSEQWEEIWDNEGTEGLVQLYKQGLLKTMSEAKGRAYVVTYPIRSIDGIVKYYLLFATRHPKGAILMSDIVYGREKSYARDVEDYKRNLKERQAVWQPSLFSSSEYEPSEQEIFLDKVKRLQEDIRQEFGGKTIDRQTIHATMLPTWFGKIKGPHITKALRTLEEEGIITHRLGPRSNPYTQFTFQD